MVKLPAGFTAEPSASRQRQRPSAAMKDYEAQRKEARAKSERLREERMTREAANPPVKAAKKRSAKKTAE
jgi:hypothetical protein